MSSRELSAFFVLTFLCFIISVHCQVPGDLRLVRNGSSSQYYSYGRLQVYVGGQWGEVCEDGFSKVERDVACHQLGYMDSIDSMDNSSYGDIGSLMLSEVNCFGNDDYLHLLRCAYKAGLHSCQRKYVSLNCSTTPIWDDPYNGQLRLINGDTTSEGTVLVYCNGRWGTICTSGDSVNNEAADLICRQLGYTSAKTNGITRRYSSSYSIWFDSLVCYPTPSVCLGTCAVCPLTASTRCTNHYYDLTIQCVYEALHYTLGSNVSSCRGFEEITRPRLGEVRQVAGGVVEVVYAENNNTFNNSWVPVCGSNIAATNIYNAETLCQQLGYSELINYTTVSSSRPNDLQFNVRCNSEFPHILWCPRTLTTCNTSLAVTCGQNISTYYPGQIRLVGGQYPSEGRVEVYDSENWVTVSYNSYRANENAHSVCRQLGYTGSIAVSSGTLPGNSSNVYTYASCYSSSSCFSYCLRYPYRSTSVGSSSSYHNTDMFVNCTFETNRRVTIGSRGSCRLYIYDYNPAPHDQAGTIAAAVIIPLVAIIIMITITATIIACYHKEKKASRARRQAASDSVRYANSGQNIAYVVQPTPGGVPRYVTAPQGMVFVPVVPGVPTNQVATNAAGAETFEEEEKNEPTDEYTPAPPTSL